MRLVSRFLGYFGLSFFFSLVAHAQAGGEAPPAPGAYTHDGFYLRLALGADMLRDSFSASSDNNLLFGDSSGTVKGFGEAHEIAVGAAIVPGFILAGAAVVDIARTTSVSQTGYEVDPGNSYAMITLGPMVDYYPFSTNGFHAQAGAGLGVVSGVQPKGAKGGSGSGIGAFAGVGHEWWVAKQWGLGALLRMQFVSAKESEFALFDTYTAHHSALAFALLFSATYN